MDYTQSNSYVIDAATGNRMHLQAQAVPTAVSDLDINSLLWSAMEIVKAANLVGAQFDKTVPATYQKLLTALRSAGVFQTAALGDNSTKAATTAFFQANSLGGAGQAWQTVIASRALGTTYTNTSGRPIEVIATVIMTSGTTATIFANVNGVMPIYGSMTATISSGSSISIMVPPGATYSINYSSGPAVLAFWTELR